MVSPKMKNKNKTNAPPTHQEKMVRVFAANIRCINPRSGTSRYSLDLSLAFCFLWGRVIFSFFFLFLFDFFSSCFFTPPQAVMLLLLLLLWAGACDGGW